VSPLGPRSKVLAVVDTSFWVAACRADVAANCLDLFDIVVPVAVEAEILSRPESTPQREYPYATLFRHLRTQMRDAPAYVSTTVHRFGRGEAEALGLAAQLGATLLINERPAAEYALQIPIPIVTVPEVVVALVANGVISLRAAGRKLDLIEGLTSPRFIAKARRGLGLFEES
jgi:predicted nucleic acid-binding protein